MNEPQKENEASALTYLLYSMPPEKASQWHSICIHICEETIYASFQEP